MSTSTYAACPAYGNINIKTACRTSSIIEPARENMSYQNSDLSDSFFTYLSQESLQKVKELEMDPAFQETVKVLQNNSSHSLNTAVNSSRETTGNLFNQNLNEMSLYIFVSFSMGEKALLNIAHEAKRFGATLILRGFREGSYLKTVQALQKILLETGQGVIIDPELYSLFEITAVPTFVLAKPFNLNAVERTQTPIKWAPIHDKLQGHASIHYALEKFAQEGDLKHEAHALLKRGSFKEGSF